VLHDLICVRGVPFNFDELRQVCSDRGLESSGPVRTLRRRLAEHVKINRMETSGDEGMAQASVQTGLVNKVEQPVSYSVRCCYHGGSVDSQTVVLGELLDFSVAGRARGHFVVLCQVVTNVQIRAG
jgi:hypothetical protein